MSITLEKIKEIQMQFDQKHKGRIPFYEQISNDNIEVLEHLIVCLVGEIGEFANVTKKVKRGDYSLQEKFSDLREELTDAFIYIIKLSNQLNIDLEESFLEKIAVNENKFEKYKVF